MIPDFPYRPACTCTTRKRRLPMKDGLPKMKDLPKEMGGSGQVLAE